MRLSGPLLVFRGRGEFSSGFSGSNEVVRASPLGWVVDVHDPKELMVTGAPIRNPISKSSAHARETITPASPA